MKVIIIPLVGDGRVIINPSAVKSVSEIKNVVVVMFKDGTVEKYIKAEDKRVEAVFDCHLDRIHQDEYRCGFEDGVQEARHQYIPPVTKRPSTPKKQRSVLKKRWEEGR